MQFSDPRYDSNQIDARYDSNTETPNGASETSQVRYDSSEENVGATTDAGRYDSREEFRSQGPYQAYRPDRDAGGYRSNGTSNGFLSSFEKVFHATNPYVERFFALSNSFWIGLGIIFLFNVLMSPSLGGFFGSIFGTLIGYGVTWLLFKLWSALSDVRYNKMRTRQLVLVWMAISTLSKIFRGGLFIRLIFSLLCAYFLTALSWPEIHWTAQSLNRVPEQVAKKHFLVWAIIQVVIAILLFMLITFITTVACGLFMDVLPGIFGDFSDLFQSYY